MADGILLERQGVPAVSICTDAFGITGEAMARTYGFPGFQWVSIPHPVASLDAEGIRQRVEEMLPRVLDLLGVEE
ncbi:hypothetical protein DQ238_13575 [Geodermatophilus sp. TF02-6]|uniref:UGSC family (seleno)protein n=1 Tax=Geodermatophilus sp. TF02-6 TaxID=2250575 RepID=UPI000DEA6842|nr:hypothetical protein [Geodermatophilus sp. TF02-6]RBY78212.1 hypothetical protein DQ238_13575 [Geodermatophilus sp. TF02-6]